VGNVGVECVWAALTAVTQNDSLTGILKASVAFTGDVDTVAVIACAAASLSDEVEQDFSESLYSGLENGPYGLDYIRALDKRLLGFGPKETEDQPSLFDMLAPEKPA
jgi:hypothetical protein